MSQKKQHFLLLVPFSRRTLAATRLKIILVFFFCLFKARTEGQGRETHFFEITDNPRVNDYN